MAALKQECDADDDGCSEEEKSLEPQECGPQSYSSPCKGSSKERDQGPCRRGGRLLASAFSLEGLHDTQVPR